MNNKKKSRDYHGLLRIVCSISIALAFAFVVICLITDDPGLAISKLLTGPLQSKRSFFNVVERMIPLVFTGLAMNVIYKSGYFNMGADGSLYMGGVIAAFIALKFPIANGVNQVLIITVAAITGGFICMLPVIIKKYTNANVTVLSIMFNSIFYYIGVAIVSNTLLEKGAGWRSYEFPSTAKLGKLIEGTNMHWGFIIMVMVVICIVILMNKTSFGYKLKVTGMNKNFAKASGINTVKTILLAQFVGGMLAGMGGAIEMIGLNKRFTWQNQVNYLWDGILVNLLAGSKPQLVPIAAFGLSYLRVGADIMSRSTSIDTEIVAIIQGIIILLVASERFLHGLKVRQEQKEALREAEETLTMEASVQGGEI